MIQIIVNEDRCNGCAICKEVCPKGPRIWKLKEKGNKKVIEVLDPSYCLYCTNCVTKCPTDAITLKL